MPRYLRHFGYSVALVAFLVVLFYIGILGFDISMRRPWAAKTEATEGSYGHAVGLYPIAATALFSGFRGLAVDLLWLKADSYWHHGQWQRLLPLYQLVAALQPRFTLVWSVGAWHMAYNLSEIARRNPAYSSERKAAEARRWMDEGILFLKKGLKYNQDKADLFFDLGWTIFDKGKDPVAAIPYLEKAVRKRDSVVNEKVLAHAYERAGRFRDALKVWKDLNAKGDTVAKKFIPRLEQKIKQGL